MLETDLFCTSSDLFGGAADGHAKAFLYENSVSPERSLQDLSDGNHGNWPAMDYGKADKVGTADLFTAQNEFDLPSDTDCYFESGVIAAGEQFIFCESINNTVNIDRASSDCNGEGLEALDATEHLAELGIWNEPYDEIGHGIDPFNIPAEDILKMAGSQYIGRASPLHSFTIRASPNPNPNPNPSHQMIFPGAEIGHLLFASAEMVGNAQHDGAVPLLLRCRELSSPLGNPLQRLAYYFTEALLERVRRETGATDDAIIGGNATADLHREAELAVLALHRALPYAQVMQFTAIQAILDAVRNAKRIHAIDLCIRNGEQWTVLMASLNQLCASLSWPPLALLKITAVGANRQKLSETGRRLKQFAKPLKVPFSYKIVVISKVEDLEEGLAPLMEDGEAIAVSAPAVMEGLLHDPARLQQLVGVIREAIRPHVLVVVEVEANHNSPSFANRFVEALFYHAAFFDSLEAALGRCSADRLRIEALCGGCIANVIAREGKDRIVRHVGTQVWRAFLRQSGFKESPLSHGAWYQAKLLLQQFHLHNYHDFTLRPNEFALTVGWKETPVCALSAWTCRDECASHRN